MHLNLKFHGHARRLAAFWVGLLALVVSIALGTGVTVGQSQENNALLAGIMALTAAEKAHGAEEKNGATETQRAQRRAEPAAPPRMHGGVTIK